MDDELGALDVAEEIVAQAGPLAGALDQARDVRHQEAAETSQFHDAENGFQRRKRVGGDLGPGRRRAGEQSALAGVGHADQPHVGDEFELQAEVALLARLAPLGSRGAWLVEVAKGRLPRPPLPPRQIRTFIPGSLRSLSRRSRSVS